MIWALKEVKNLSEEILKQEEKLKVYEFENGKLRKTIVELISQQEEASRLTGRLTHQLSIKEAFYKRQHLEVVSLRHDLENSNKELSQYQKLEAVMKPAQEKIEKIDQRLRIQPLRGGNLLYIT